MCGGRLEALARVIEALVESIVDASRPDAIILFGSTARGTMHEDSDFDLLIVKGGCSTGTETTRIYDALPWNSERPPVNVFVVPPDAIEIYRGDADSVTATALREGRTLYERGARQPTPASTSPSSQMDVQRRAILRHPLPAASSAPLTPMAVQETASMASSFGLPEDLLVRRDVVDDAEVDAVAGEAGGTDGRGDVAIDQLEVVAGADMADEIAGPLEALTATAGSAQCWSIETAGGRG